MMRAGNVSKYLVGLIFEIKLGMSEKTGCRMSFHEYITDGNHNTSQNGKDHFVAMFMCMSSLLGFHGIYETHIKVTRWGKLHPRLSHNIDIPGK